MGETVPAEERYCNTDVCVYVDREKRTVEVVSWGLRIVIRGFEEIEVVRGK